MKNYLILLFVFTGSALIGQSALNLFGQTFKHTATRDNIVQNWTVIDNPNREGDDLLQVTADYGTTGANGNKSIGVWYSNGRWNIFNQDRSPMAVGATFNVMRVKPSRNNTMGPTPNDNAFMHTSTETLGAVTVIDHPRLNNSPNARFLVTQNWGNAGPYNNNPIGVHYNGTRWTIFNQNAAPMPLNAKFNILVDDAIIVVETNVSSGNSFFPFDHSSISNRPDAVVFATQYRTDEVYNASEIGVWYDAGHSSGWPPVPIVNAKWSVYNQSGNPLPAGAKFMVWGYDPGCATVYEQPNYQGRSMVFCEAGIHEAPFPIRSAYIPNEYDYFFPSNCGGSRSNLPACDNRLTIISTSLLSRRLPYAKIDLLQVSSNIHNGDCQRLYGTVGVRMTVEDARGSIHEIRGNWSNQHFVNWDRGPVREIPNYSAADVRDLIRVGSHFRVDRQLESHCFITITSDLGSAHKGCDLCTDFTWEAKMPQPQTYRISLADALSQRIIEVGPYRTADNRHDIRIKFKITRS